jgi:hypothetical protein
MTDTVSAVTYLIVRLPVTSSGFLFWMGIRNKSLLVGCTGLVHYLNFCFNMVQNPISSEI